MGAQRGRVAVQRSLQTPPRLPTMDTAAELMGGRAPEWPTRLQAKANFIAKWGRYASWSAGGCWSFLVLVVGRRSGDRGAGMTERSRPIRFARVASEGCVCRAGQAEPVAVDVRAAQTGFPYVTGDVTKHDRRPVRGRLRSVRYTAGEVRAGAGMDPAGTRGVQRDQWAVLPGAGIDGKVMRLDRAVKSPVQSGAFNVLRGGDEQVGVDHRTARGGCWRGSGRCCVRRWSR